MNLKQTALHKELPILPYAYAKDLVLKAAFSF